MFALWVRDMSWKDLERVAARRLNGKRTGNLGVAAADVVSDRLSIECKSRESLPKWLTGAVEQAVRNIEDGRVPVVVLHQKHRRHDDDLVMMRLSDFERWTGTCSCDRVESGTGIPREI